MCVRRGAPRSWDGFGTFAPLITSGSIRLSVQFLRGTSSTAALAVWACIAPPGTVQHLILLGRDSWMRCSSSQVRRSIKKVVNCKQRALSSIDISVSLASLYLCTSFTFGVDSGTRVRISLRTFLFYKRLRVRPTEHISVVSQVFKRSG